MRGFRSAAARSNRISFRFWFGTRGFYHFLGPRGGIVFAEYGPRHYWTVVIHGRDANGLVLVLSLPAAILAPVWAVFAPLSSGPASVIVPPPSPVRVFSSWFFVFVTTKIARFFSSFCPDRSLPRPELLPTPTAVPLPDLQLERFPLRTCGLADVDDSFQNARTPLLNESAVARVPDVLVALLKRGGSPRRRSSWPTGRLRR